MSVNNNKILAILGATGQQGGSVVNHVLNDPALSAEYTIRALTRDPTSPAAQALQSLTHSKTEIEVVQADITSRDALTSAFKDVHTVFSVTTVSLGPDGINTELATASLIAEVAAEQGVQHFIWSTLPSVSEASGGKYTAVTAFEAKAQAEKYILGLAAQGKFKASFFAAASYMENFASQPFLAPRKRVDGRGEEEWVLARPCAPTVRMPLIAARADVGKFVGALLAEPDKYATTTGEVDADGCRGRVVSGAEGLYSFEEIVRIASAATGKKIVYEQVSLEQFKDSLKMLPLNLGDMFAEGYAAYGETGYFGSDTDTTVEWGVKQARGKLTTLEEFFAANPWVF